jgi:hydrogenase-4 component F
MALLLILLAPLAAAGVALLPLDRRAAPLATLAAALIVLGLALSVAAAAAGGGAESFGGALSCDGLGALVLVLVAFVGSTAALYSWGYIGRRPESAGGARLYYCLYNLFMLSMVAVPIVSNLAFVWVAVELTTLISAFLVGFDGTPEALEAAWKYVVLTTLGAVVALLGFLILFWGSQLEGAAPFTWAGLAAAAPHMPPALLWPAFLFILVGFGTKVGLVPMHTWLPDAHSQAPASICALLSGVETTTALYVILRLFPVLGAAPGLDARPWYMGLGLLSVAIAALLLVFVRDFKRLFAYSTVEHMGIILFAAGIGGADAHLGALYQIAAHSIAKSFCFFAAGLAAMAMGTQEIAAVRGLARSAPLPAAALVAGALAIAGAPPFAVFVGEFLILKGGLAAGDYVTIALFAGFIVLGFCAILFHVNRMVFGGGGERARPAAPLSCRAGLALAAIPLFVIGIYVPPALFALLRAAAGALGS